ncbi:hypothetical protein B0I32_10874 [Nonomuraea fuscirosea]|uniref:Uncharacterized protein n=1 Tax=Nonomuraea fuscirosea TaxID=1291556 RepID=A0A2T0MZA9_9ACTN|nr:hypothetical protein [Nonomuraea fuscirosea]PRX64713.1 hypothetical protein B0I32_10874 [Nonomuraea fuscirosea]
MPRPGKKPHPLALDPVLIIGTALSVLLGVIFYVREDTAQGLALVAGLIGGVITLQVQTLLREKRRVDHETKVGQMVATIEKIPWLPDLMLPMLRAAKHVEREYAATPAVDACRAAFEDCLRTLADLERGHFRSTYGDNAVFQRLIGQTKHTMCATSVPSVDLDWWNEPVGRQYWQAQLDALARGVTIRRVFIYKEWTAELDSLAREQLAAGVKVLKVRAERLPPALRVISGLWDGTCGHELSYTAAGEAVYDTFTVSPPDLERLMTQFEMIERSAVEIGEPKLPDSVS